MSRGHAHRYFEEEQLKQQTRAIPIGEDFMDDTLKGDKPAGKKKDHRVSFSIGAFNDGLRTTLSKPITQ